MKMTLERRMASYAAYHRNRMNRLTHFVGIPLVVFSVFLVLAWFRFIYEPLPISAATVFYVMVVANYFYVDWQLALVQFPLTLFLLILAEHAARLPFAESMVWFLLAFLGGWAFQLAGHVFEGRRPAFFDNISQLLNGPIFIVCELLFLVGWRPDLRRRIVANLAASDIDKQR
jgi:uncharacterized membrane protein YGL010W